MLDLGISLIVYLLLPGSTLLNVILLFPVPQFLKKRIRSSVSGVLIKVFILAAVLFGIYAYAYNTTSFHLSEVDSVEHRLEARSKQWKMERNYHITFFNLVNWTVATGAESLLAKIDAKNANKKKSN
jgi:hypothetical protein